MSKTVENPCAFLIKKHRAVTERHLSLLSGVQFTQRKTGSCHIHTELLICLRESLRPKLINKKCCVFISFSHIHDEWNGLYSGSKRIRKVNGSNFVVKIDEKILWNSQKWSSYKQGVNHYWKIEIVKSIENYWKQLNIVEGIQFDSLKSCMKFIFHTRFFLFANHF